MKKFNMNRPERVQRTDSNANMDGIFLVSGKWGYVHPNSERESLRFVVTYLEKGKVRKAYSITSFSHDIKEAIATNV